MKSKRREEQKYQQYRNTEIYLRPSRLDRNSDVFPHHRSQRCYKRYNSDDKLWFHRTRSAERRVSEVFDTLSWQLFLLESVCCFSPSLPPLGNGAITPDSPAILGLITLSTQFCRPKFVLSFPSSLPPPQFSQCLILLCVDGRHRSCHHTFYPFNPFSTILSNANLITSFYSFKFLKRFPSLTIRVFSHQDVWDPPWTRPSELEPSRLFSLPLPLPPLINILCSTHTKLYYLLFPWYARVSKPHAFGLALLPASYLSSQISFPTSTILAKCPYPVHIFILSFLALLTCVYFLHELKNAEGYGNQISSFWHEMSTW